MPVLSPTSAAPPAAMPAAVVARTVVDATTTGLTTVVIARRIVRAVSAAAAAAVITWWIISSIATTATVIAWRVVRAVSAAAVIVTRFTFPGRNICPRGCTADRGQHSGHGQGGKVAPRHGYRVIGQFVYNPVAHHGSSVRHEGAGDVALPARISWHPARHIRILCGCEHWQKAPTSYPID